MGTRIQNIWEGLRSTYWFIPTIMILGAFGLSFITPQLEDRYQNELAEAFPGVFQGGPSGARSMLATIAGSMITAAAVTFSITIAALANASSQFGPRLLRIFMQDTGSQVVLGTFVGTFIYCLMALRLIPVDVGTDYAPHLSTSVALLLAIASIGVLIYFIHHMATMLQASNVTARVGEEMLASINRIFPEELAWGPSSDTQGDAIPLSEMNSRVIPDSNQREIDAERIGYVRAIDEEALMETAVRHDVVIRIALRPGAFVVPDALLAVVWPSEHVTDELSSSLQDVFLVGRARTPFQDIELFYDELTEIALRALSPGINDPYTAHTCIDWLTAGFSSLASRRLPSRYRYDNEDRLRIIADSPRLDELIQSTFDQIRNSGKSYPSVLRKLLESVRIIAPLLDNSSELQALQQQASAIDLVVRTSTFVEHEREFLVDCYHQALEAINAADLS